MKTQELRTTVGLCSLPGRRKSNEDAVITAHLDDGRELIAVADGMGGHKAGEVASQSALQTILEALQRGLGLAAAVAEANSAVFRAAAANAAWNGMGTTVVALLRSQDSYEIASVGDSRAYRISDDGIQQITRDHCLVAEAIAAGGTSADAVRNSRWRNALTRSIGSDATVDVDVFGPFDACQAHTTLLCTDGLHGSLADPAIRRAVRESTDAATAAQRLAQEAYSSGSSDNISVAVVAFGVQSESILVPVQRREGMPLVNGHRTRPVVLSSPRLSSPTRKLGQRLLNLFSSKKPGVR